MEIKEYEAALTAIVADPETAGDQAKALLDQIKQDKESAAAAEARAEELKGQLSKQRAMAFQAQLGNTPNEEPKEPTMDEKIAQFRAKLNKELNGNAAE